MRRAGPKGPQREPIIQIGQGQGDIIGKSSIFGHNTEHGPVRTMFRSISVTDSAVAAAQIDGAHYPPANPLFALRCEPCGSAKYIEL
jgi:hypothetical protein